MPLLQILLKIILTGTLVHQPRVVFWPLVLIILKKSCKSSKDKVNVRLYSLLFYKLLFEILTLI